MSAGPSQLELGVFKLEEELRQNDLASDIAKSELPRKGIRQSDLPTHNKHYYSDNDAEDNDSPNPLVKRSPSMIKANRRKRSASLFRRKDLSVNFIRSK